MHLVTTDGVLWLLGSLAELLLVILIVSKKMSRSYPMLLAYLLFNLLEDPLGWVLRGGSDLGYQRFYTTVTILDYVLQLLLILEIGRNVLVPARRSLPIPLLPVATVSVLLCAIVAATFSPRVPMMGLQHASQLFLRITLGLAVLKLLLFAALAGFAQFLGLGWRNLVLRLASGLAFYGAVSLTVQLAISHLRSEAHDVFFTHYVELTRIQSIAYLLTLVAWAWAFSRNDAPRKDFTPQMQQVLVTIAGTARRTRIAVTRSGGPR